LPQVVACTGVVLGMLPPLGPAQPGARRTGWETDQGRVAVGDLVAGDRGLACLAWRPSPFGYRHNGWEGVCVWRGDLGDTAMPLPDERLDLVWVDDGSLWLSGPETTSWSRGYRPGTTAVGVGFKPGVGPAAPRPRRPGHHGDHADQAPALALTSDPYKTRPPWARDDPASVVAPPVSRACRPRTPSQRRDQARC